MVAGQAAQEVDQFAHLRALLRRAGRELHSHAVAGMRDSHHALGMNFHLFGFQAKVDQGALGKRRVGLHVAAAQTQVGQFTVRYGFVGTAFSGAAAACSQAFSSADVASARSRK